MQIHWELRFKFLSFLSTVYSIIAKNILAEAEGIWPVSVYRLHKALMTRFPLPRNTLTPYALSIQKRVQLSMTVSLLSTCFFSSSHRSNPGCFAACIVLVWCRFSYALHTMHIMEPDHFLHSSSRRTETQTWQELCHVSLGAWAFLSVPRVIYLQLAVKAYALKRIKWEKYCELVLNWYFTSRIKDHTLSWNGRHGWRWTYHCSTTSVFRFRKLSLPLAKAQSLPVIF